MTDSNSPVTYTITDVFGDVYTIQANAGSPMLYTIKQVNGKLEISDQRWHDWDGTWIKQ